jgi:hypothetical protein
VNHRTFAREAKKAFEAPPDPPQSTVDKIRWPLVIALFGGVTYIAFLPENDHGLFKSPPQAGEEPQHSPSN